MKNEDSMESQIKSFWDWFAGVAPILADTPNRADLLAELDKRVTRMNPALSWEIGPGLQESWQLVISPSLSRELRNATSRIVKLAPRIEEWEFHSSRQVKDWDFTFQLSRSEGEFIDIDASRWTFVLLRYPDGLKEVLLKADHLPRSLNEEDRHEAAAIALEGVLGEELFLQAIDDFDLVDVLEDRFLGKDRPIKSLRRAILGQQ